MSLARNAWYFVFWLAVALLSTPSLSFAVTSDQLHDSCLISERRNLEPQDHADSFLNGLCIGYLSGFIDSYRIAEAITLKAGVTPNAICPPHEGVATPQLIRAVLLRMERGYPKDISPRILVLEGLSQAYPCQDASPVKRKRM